jgi:hypothetical protein
LRVTRNNLPRVVSNRKSAWPVRDELAGGIGVGASGTINGGEVSEWLMVPLSKSGLVMSQRGFESHPLRQAAASRRGALSEGSHSWPSARDWKSRRR